MRRIGLSAVCLHQVESPNALRVTLEPGAMVGRSTPARSNRVLLAYAQPDIVDEVVARGLEPITPNTLHDRGGPARDPRPRSGSAGIARSDGEFISGSVGIAAPVFRDGGIVGAVGVIGPAARCGLAWRTRVARLLPEAAAAIQSGLEDESRSIPPSTIR